MVSTNGKKREVERGEGSRLQDPWHVLRGVKAVVTGIHAVSIHPQFGRALLSGCSPEGVEGDSAD